MKLVYVCLHARARATFFTHIPYHPLTTKTPARLKGTLIGMLIAKSSVRMNTARLFSTVLATSLLVSANAYAQDQTNTPPATPSAEEKEEKTPQLPAPPLPPPAVQIAPQTKPLPDAQPQVVTPVQIAPQTKPLRTQPSEITPASIWWGKNFEIPEKPSKRWYGWQTLIVLAAADLTTIVSYQNRPGEAAGWGLILGISTHALAGPVVHWAHGHVGRGFGAFGLNASFTALGVLAGIVIGQNDAIKPLGIAGYFIGSAIDVAFLSTETIREPFLPTAGRSAWSVTNFGIVPLVDANKRGLLFVGQF